MGKSKTGKKLPKGICQRKDGLYSARYLNGLGNRVEKHFKVLSEAKQWLENERYEDGLLRTGRKTVVVTPEARILDGNCTVDEWHQYWLDHVVNHLAANTIRNYRERYEHNAKAIIGQLRLKDVKPLHCQAVFQSMESRYQVSTIKQAYITLGTMFKSAKMNGLIDRHPMDGVRFNKPLRDPKDIHYLSVEEQEKFLLAAGSSNNYEVYRLILETGLRTGEVIGLTWDSIDWEARTLTVSKVLEFRHKQQEWRAGPPKTRSSYRTVPLTQAAYDLLLELYENRLTRKESGALQDTVLEYSDNRNGRKCLLRMKDLVFVNSRTGNPNKNSSYDTHLYKLCDKAGIGRFCMHALRHTYATRAIERGVQPKTLQKLLGHANLATTMDRYVHVTDESLWQAVRQFETAAGQTAS